jgi:hypothetical protein
VEDREALGEQRRDQRVRPEQPAPERAVDEHDRFALA